MVFPAPGLAFGQVPLADADCDLRATQIWVLFVLNPNPDLFCLLLSSQVDLR